MGLKERTPEDFCRYRRCVFFVVAVIKNLSLTKLSVVPYSLNLGRQRARGASSTGVGLGSHGSLKEPAWNKSGVKACPNPNNFLRWAGVELFLPCPGPAYSRSHSPVP